MSRRAWNHEIITFLACVSIVIMKTNRCMSVNTCCDSIIDVSCRFFLFKDRSCLPFSLNCSGSMTSTQQRQPPWRLKRIRSFIGKSKVRCTHNMQRKCCTNVPTSDEVYNEHSEEEDKPPAEVLQKQLQRRAARQLLRLILAESCMK